MGLTKPDWKATYDSMSAIYEALAEEVAFILDGVIGESEIKIHNIEKRVKQKSSIEQKCLDKDIDDPLTDLNDIVGTRVICLFKDDLQELGALINRYFDVLEIDDKVNIGSETFGYMSVHYICRIKQGYAGYRYEKLKDLEFEIQVRTLCMHAWAVVSHYIDYKGDWDVPAELKRSLNALSALFYVADSQFEALARARQASQAMAVEETKKQAPQEINLDTVSAYLIVKFAERKRSPESSISEFVKELKDAGYATIEDVAADIDRAEAALPIYEKDSPPPPEGKFTNLGAARMSLAISSEKYRGQKYTGNYDWKKYESMLKPSTAGC